MFNMRIDHVLQDNDFSQHNRPSRDDYEHEDRHKPLSLLAREERSDEDIRQRLPSMDDRFTYY